MGAVFEDTAPAGPRPISEVGLPLPLPHVSSLHVVSGPPGVGLVRAHGSQVPLCRKPRLEHPGRQSGLRFELLYQLWNGFSVCICVCE